MSYTGHSSIALVITFLGINFCQVLCFLWTNCAFIQVNTEILWKTTYSSLDTKLNFAICTCCSGINFEYVTFDFDRFGAFLGALLASCILAGLIQIDSGPLGDEETLQSVNSDKEPSPLHNIHTSTCNMHAHASQLHHQDFLACPGSFFHGFYFCGCQSICGNCENLDPVKIFRYTVFILSHPVADGPSSVLIVMSRTILFVESSFFALNIL